MTSSDRVFSPLSEEKKIKKQIGWFPAVDGEKMPLQLNVGEKKKKIDQQSEEKKSWILSFFLSLDLIVEEFTICRI